jgi:hypothetical protein
MAPSAPLQLATSFAAALTKIDSVCAAMDAYGVKIKPNNSVGSLFAKVRQLNKQHAANAGQYDAMKFYASIEALWIAEALEMALGDPGARASIERVIGNEIDLSGRKESQGKDALWELDVYRRLKLGGATVRLAEPDVVLSLGGGLGDYGISCKKVYQESGVAGALKKGCEQLDTACLRGVVAFNLDESMDEKAVQHAPSRQALHAAVAQRAQAFIARHAPEFNRAIQRGECDGVLVAISAVCEIPDAAPSISLARIPVLYSSAMDEPSKARLAAFQGHLDQATTLAKSS